MLLFFGGSDPNNLTLKQLNQFILVEKFNLKILIITGIGYKFELILKSMLKIKKYTVNKKYKENIEIYEK